MTLLIAEALEFSPAALARLREQLVVRTGDLSRKELIEAVADVDILWVRLRSLIDREVMAAAPRLRVIVTNTTGLDHIDLGEAERRNIRVLSLRGETAFWTPSPQPRSSPSRCCSLSSDICPPPSSTYERAAGIAISSKVGIWPGKPSALSATAGSAEW